MNKTVIVRDIRKETFELAMQIVADSKKDFRVNGYKIIDNELYLSTYSKNCDKLPYEFDVKQATEFAWGWYQSVAPTDDEPDTDGSTRVAFELSTERCGVGSDDWGMCCSIKPIWFIYGK
jgi:hypothetical protein